MPSNIKRLFFDRPLALCGRLFGIDAAYLASGTIWLTLGKFANLLIGFTLSVLYARFISKVAYGDYRYVLSITGTLGIFALPGIGTAIQRAVARGYDATFVRGIRIMFYSSLIISLCCFALAAHFLIAGKGNLAAGLVFGGLLIPFSEGLGGWRGYFEGKKEFRKKTIWNIKSHVFYGGMMIAAVLIIAKFELSYAISAPILLCAYFLSDALPNIYFFRKTRASIEPETKEEPRAIRYGMHLSLLNIPATIANYLDALLVHAYLGAGALALYSFAIAPLEQLKAFLSTIPDVAFPKLSAQTVNESQLAYLKHTLPKKALRASLATGVVIGIYILIAPYLFQIFFPKYIDAVLYSRIFSLSLVLFPLGILSTAIKAEGRIQHVYIYNIGAPVIQIIALLVFIPAYGLMGAIIGRIVGRFAYHIIPYFIFRQHTIKTP